MGVSARTSVGVLCQYLDTVQDLQIMPQIFPTDPGTETPLCANAHFMLRKRTLYEDLKFEDRYYYGRSIANQRIEEWWGQLSKGTVFQWQVSSHYSYNT